MDKHKRKAMVLEYKQTPKLAGIYQVKNNVSGKAFVGGSPNLDGKLNGTRFQLEAGAHKNTDLQRDWNKYGEENFSFAVLEVLEPSDDHSPSYKDELKALEEKWLEKLQPYNERGYRKKKR